VEVSFAIIQQCTTHVAVKKVIIHIKPVVAITLNIQAITLNATFLKNAAETNYASLKQKKRVVMGRALLARQKLKSAAVTSAVRWIKSVAIGLAAIMDIVVTEGTIQSVF